ncbi:hypothetical protein [Streptomonospora litoralis]|uniref:Uncharacterized protein n=1 Tax=Streptomonospora litoralis TaxID=2498135 RepID=A0A4P6QAP8_9ACTN|nr:hypothetical protein [Streptomonospora litoralis]QBI56841.1 hypothetical protein EKD16_25505 [Streptomonospora litoralis]
MTRHRITVLDRTITVAIQLDAATDDARNEAFAAIAHAVRTLNLGRDAFTREPVGFPGVTVADLTDLHTRHRRGDGPATGPTATPAMSTPVRFDPQLAAHPAHQLPVWRA